MTEKNITRMIIIYAEAKQRVETIKTVKQRTTKNTTVFVRSFVRSFGYLSSRQIAASSRQNRPRAPLPACVVCECESWFGINNTVRCVRAMIRFDCDVVVCLFAVVVLNLAPGRIYEPLQRRVLRRRMPNECSCKTNASRTTIDR
jgi:hypothetical protein